jgi:hypothetical protein
LLGLVAAVLPLPHYFQIIIGILWVLAFSSSTQDICADGVYITTLEKAEQAKWIGWQGAAWNTGRIFATALVVYVAGKLQESGQSPKAARAIDVSLAGLVMAVGVDPLKLTNISMMLTAASLPVTVIPMLVLMNDEALVGEHRNRWFGNIALGALSIVTIIVMLSAVPLQIMGGS